MQLLQICFSPGSGVLPYSAAILVIALLLPWRDDKQNYRLIAGCLAVYVLSELVVTFGLFTWSWMYGCLFVGGAALSVGLGRLMKSIWKIWRVR